jgi:hypothetical protein
LTSEIGRLRKMIKSVLADVWSGSPIVFLWSLLVFVAVYGLIGLIMYTATNGDLVELPIGAYLVLWPAILTVNLVIIIIDLVVQAVFLTIAILKRGKK